MSERASEQLPIPTASLSQHAIALGKTRSGKSSKLRVIVEYLLEQAKPVCIIDPKGDWWGLKSSASGKTSGYPIVIFGGEHADVPLNPHAGAHVAELVATGNRSCLIDLGGWMVSDRTRFFIDFASTLFKFTRGNRYLAIDECHNFATKGRIFDVEAGKCLHWANRLASEGQGKGLVLLAASQRPQKVHNDFLTSCETLIACRVIHKADRDAIKDWIDGCADPATGREVLASLAKMPRSDAWVWSPEIDFGPKQITFPMFRTYDSFKPQPADLGKLKGWADVDLEEVKTKLAGVVAEAEANDPKKLKARIAALEQQIAKPPRVAGDLPKGTKLGPGRIIPIDPTSAAELKQLRVRVSALDRDNKALTDYSDRLFAAMAVLQALVDEASTATDQVRSKLREAAGARMPKQPKPSAPVPVATPVVGSETGRTATPAPRTSRPAAMPDQHTGLTGREQRVLDAVAWLKALGIDQPTNPQVAVAAGYSPNSTSYTNPRGGLSTKGLIAYLDEGRLRITDEGLQLAAPQDIPTADELRARILAKLTGRQQKVLRVLIDVYPSALTNDELADRAGYSPNSTSYTNPRGELRSLGFVRYEGGTVAATDSLFPEVRP